MAERHHHVVTVMAFVPDGAGRVLLVRPHGRGWELPGGRVEPGEDVVQATVREVDEETGCRVEVEALLGIDCRVSEPEMVMLRFTCRYLAGEPRPSDETPEVGWFTADEARALITDELHASRLADALSGPPQVIVRRYERPYRLLDEHRLEPRSPAPR
jgi:8-oxo-dGTP diphosphatase